MSNGAQLRKYGVEFTIDFDLFEVDGVDFRVDAVHASGDSKIMKDEGTEANTSNGFTDEGTGYSLVVTATEAQAARIVVYLVDQTATKVWLDRKVIIETYGNASAQHAFDLDTASVPQTADHTAAIADVPTVAEFNARTLVAANYTIVSDLGTVQTADHTAGIADIPTVAEFNARTLLAASYFDPTADAVANVTLCATTTTNTDMVAEPTTLLVTQMSEAYAADGVAPTVAQALFAIQQFLQERSTATTTVTVKKLDGSATAMTFTLDDATTPTSITRAT